MTTASFSRALLVLATAALAVSGCRCKPPPVSIQAGEISIEYSTEGVTMSSTTSGTYDFGQVPMGRTANLKLVIKNTGGGVLFLDALEKSSGDAVQIGEGGEPAPVFVVGFEPKEIASGEKVEFDLSFISPTENKPTVAHESRLILRATNTEIGKEAAELVLKGLSVSGECELPSVLDFGGVEVRDSVPLSVKVKNTRPIDAVSFIGEIMSNSGDDQAFTFSVDSPKGDVALKAGQEKTITIGFSPTAVHVYLAYVTMRRLDGCPDKIVQLKGEGLDKVLAWAPNPLNMGYVTPGLQVGGEMTFSNYGVKEVTLTQLKTDKADYKVVTPEPVVVPGSTRDAAGNLVPGKVKLGLTFKPTLLGPRPARLDFNTNLPRQPSGVEQLQGFGGGPDIDVKPSTLNFGRVAYFAGASPAAYVTRKLTIQNVGSRPTPADPAANLRLGAGGTGVVYWDVRVKPGVAGNTARVSELCVGELNSGTCTNRPSAASYDQMVGIEASGVKALLDVPVRITPEDAGGIKEWEVVIHSNDPDEPDFLVTIHAEAVVVPPCDYEVTPLALNFGLLTPPDYKDLSFRIRNRSQTAGDLCLVSNLDIKAGSDVIFSLPAGALVDKEIQPGGELIVSARAWPQGTVPQNLTNVAGAVIFSISNPTKPEGIVSLTAAIATSCLIITPDDLSFGTVKKDCSSATRTFSIYNTCSPPNMVRIESFSMVSPAGEKKGDPNCPAAGGVDCPEFLPVNTAGLAPGTVVTPGAVPITFSLKYHPINYGPDSGAFLIKVTQNGSIVDYIVTLSGKGDTMGLNTDTFKQDTRPKADILLVIDNSCSMSDKQMSLSQNFGSFIKYATTAMVDYQIGVTTTDMSAEAGRIVGDATNPKVLRPSTPDVENKFKAKVNLGINGSATEQTLLPAVSGLTAPLITADNAGLLRPDAVLAVVAITDADDQSPQPVTLYVNQLLNIKGTQLASQFSFNAVGPYLATAPLGCSYDGIGGAPRLLAAVTATAGVKEEICTPDWSKALEQIGKNAFGYRTNFFLTSGPDLTAGKTIVVMIDGVVLDPIDIRGAQVWTYDSTTNTVNFEPLFVPEPGKTLTITYFVDCFS